MWQLLGGVEHLSAQREAPDQGLNTMGQGWAPVWSCIFRSRRPGGGGEVCGEGVLPSSRGEVCVSWPLSLPWGAAVPALRHPFWRPLRCSLGGRRGAPVLPLGGLLWLWWDLGHGRGSLERPSSPSFLGPSLVLDTFPQLSSCYPWFSFLETDAEGCKLTSLRLTPLVGEKAGVPDSKPRDLSARLCRSRRGCFGDSDLPDLVSHQPQNWRPMFEERIGISLWTLTSGG